MESLTWVKIWKNLKHIPLIKIAVVASVIWKKSWKNVNDSNELNWNLWMEKLVPDTTWQAVSVKLNTHKCFSINQDLSEIGFEIELEEICRNLKLSMRSNQLEEIKNRNRGKVSKFLNRKQQNVLAILEILIEPSRKLHKTDAKKVKYSKQVDFPRKFKWEMIFHKWDELGKTSGEKWKEKKFMNKCWNWNDFNDEVETMKNFQFFHHTELMRECERGDYF